jgi:hypothetical protein
MKTYMVVHRAPELSWEAVEENWRKLANVETAKWIYTFYNVEKSVRFCVWHAPDRKTLEKVFVDLDISFESITEVTKTKPDLWGDQQWEKHLEAEAAADTLGV